MSRFPADFADLEPFADWALPSEGDRYAKRIASSMDELQAFYDAAFPRLEREHRVPRVRRARRHLATRTATCSGCSRRW